MEGLERRERLERREGLERVWGGARGWSGARVWKSERVRGGEEGGRSAYVCMCGLGMRNKQFGKREGEGKRGKRS